LHQPCTILSTQTANKVQSEVHLLSIQSHMILRIMKEVMW